MEKVDPGLCCDSMTLSTGRIWQCAHKAFQAPAGTVSPDTSKQTINKTCNKTCVHTTYGEREKARSMCRHFDIYFDGWAA